MNRKILLLLITAVLITGCTAKEKKMSNPFLAAGPQVPIPQPSKPQEPSDNGLGISDSKYQEIIKKSLVTTGNNHLVKQVLAKLNAGQEIIVAAIGGSVTEGAGPQDFHDGYAYQFMYCRLNQ